MAERNADIVVEVDRFPREKMEENRSRSRSRGRKHRDASANERRSSPISLSAKSTSEKKRIPDIEEDKRGKK